MKSTTFPAAYSERRGRVAGMCSNSSNFFGLVVLRHLMVVGKARRRRWPARFRRRPPRILIFNNLCKSPSDARFVL